ncbi:MAG: hypothetical protein RH948_04145 [Cyclobacteriaceae bacterium]
MLSKLRSPGLPDLNRKFFGALDFRTQSFHLPPGWGSDTLWAGLDPDSYREAGERGLHNVCCCCG